MRLTVNVTEQHILAATPRDWKCSALSLALMDAGCDWAIVSPGWSWAGLGGRACDVLLPDAAQDFLRREDQNQPRKPFQFTVALIPYARDRIKDDAQQVRRRPRDRDDGGAAGPAVAGHHRLHTTPVGGTQ
jgi:hypothetical protein